MHCRNWLFALALPAFATACAAEVDDDRSSSERGPIGKADALDGSCQAGNGTVEFCGGKGTGLCYCDELCVEYGDCCADAGEVCGIGDFTDCAPMDAQGQGICLAFIGIKWNGSGCQGFSGCSCQGEDCGSLYQSKEACEDDHLECTGDECPPVLCELFCEHGFATDANGCEVCSCEDGPQMCGGFAGFPCPDGELCVDDPNDGCDPLHGGADCSGICVEPNPSSCAGHCGGQSQGKSCWCDDQCAGYGDCCDDVDDWCDFRTAASGQCVKNSNDGCSSDADCNSGGCGGELCFNPEISSGISTCECVEPTNVGGCGCVQGQCTWWK